jgi:hypothetical protein
MKVTYMRQRARSHTNIHSDMKIVIPSANFMLCKLSLHLHALMRVSSNDNI